MNYGFSERYYDAMRRRRAWSMAGRNGLNGYAAFLAGTSDGGDELAALIGAGTAAADSEASSPSPYRVVFIGVATGALTFLVNHWLGKLIK